MIVKSPQRSSRSRAPYRALRRGKSPFPNVCAPVLCAIEGEDTTLKMGWCDEILGLKDASGGNAEADPSREELAARLAALPMADLVRAWRVVCTTGLKDETPGTRAFASYFDGLSQETPERGIAFIEAELAGEPEDEIVMLLAEGKVLGQLLVFHARRVATDLQALALRQPRFRWLMGRKAASIENRMVEDPHARRRLLAIADEAAYRAWRDSTRPKSGPVDFAAMPLPQLAAAWVEVTSRSDLAKARDGDWDAMFDFQHELVSNDPLGALDLVKAILSIEDHPNVLGLLAAGMLEDLIPDQDGPVVDAVVAEAAQNPRFRELLRGVWFYGMSPEVTERLENARGEGPR
jgi:hypothetical protein